MFSSLAENFHRLHFKKTSWQMACKKSNEFLGSMLPRSKWINYAEKYVELPVLRRSVCVCLWLSLDYNNMTDQFMSVCFTSWHSSELFVAA